MRDSQSSLSRGFGFVTFSNEQSSVNVLQNRFHHIHDKRVEVKSAVPRAQIAPKPNSGGYNRHIHGQVSGCGGYNRSAWTQQGGGGCGPGGYAPATHQHAWPNAGHVGSNIFGGTMSPEGMWMGGNAQQSKMALLPGAMTTHGWTEHIAPEGYRYYYNSQTGISQWEKPLNMETS